MEKDFLLNLVPQVLDLVFEFLWQRFENYRFDYAMKIFHWFPVLGNCSSALETSHFLSLIVLFSRLMIFCWFGHSQIIHLLLYIKLLKKPTLLQFLITSSNHLSFLYLRVPYHHHIDYVLPPVQSPARLVLDYQRMCLSSLAAIEALGQIC